MCAYERGPVAVKVYSENQKNIDDLAERLERGTSFSTEQAKLVAYDLLCRKALKIKSSALAQIFRSADKECDTKAMRDELLAAEIVTKIDGSGVNGRPAFYTINATVFEDAGDGEELSTFEGVISEGEQMSAEDEVEGGSTSTEPEPAAPCRHVDTDETLDENVVRAFTARAGRGSRGSGKREVQRRAAQERFRAAALGHTVDSDEAQVAGGGRKQADSQMTAKLAALQKAERVSAERDKADAPKRRRGAHFKQEQPMEAEAKLKNGKPVDAVSAKDDVKGKGAERDASCRPGRGFVAREQAERSGRKTRAVKIEGTEEKSGPNPTEVKEGDAKAEAKVAVEAEPKPAPVGRTEHAEDKKAAPRHRHRGSRGSGSSKTTNAATSEQKESASDAKRDIPAEGESKSSVSQTQKGRENAQRKQRDGGQRPAAKKTATAAEEHAPEPSAKRTGDRSNSQQRDVSPLDIARVLGRRILKAVPTSTSLAKIREQQTQIVKVDKGGKKPVQGRPAHNDMSNRKIAEDVATVVAWVERTRGTDIPFASRRQRAYEIFNDEKAFDGKRGERLVKRLAEKGIQMSTLKVTPARPVHFTGFYTLGADKPFIMVENLDTYDEIVKLLRGRKNAKLFGIKVGGVIFGGGCKASVSHALDDYLAEIGYRYNYVYYVGDIDREGARIVEQTRNANVTEVRLHAGMYRAMIAEHKRRVKAGGECEPAAANQGVPQNLAATIKDLPMVTRVQFRNILREGGRIPQEILMSADYRDGDSGGFDRMLNN